MNLRAAARVETLFDGTIGENSFFLLRGEPYESLSCAVHVAAGYNKGACSGAAYGACHTPHDGDHGGGDDAKNGNPISIRHFHKGNNIADMWDTIPHHQIRPPPFPS